MIGETLRKAVTEVCESVGAGNILFSVEHPGDLSHGDYSTNAALVAAKALGKNPRALAEEIVHALGLAKPVGVERVEIAGPGFINFYLTGAFFSSELERIQHLGDTWGHGRAEAGNEVLLEYTSPNLFKPLHVGNLVGNIVGESLARLFGAAGATVRRINYPSDIGLTVAKGVWGLQKTEGNPDDITALGEAYRMGNGAYENEPDAKVEIEAINRALYQGGDEVLNTLRAKGVATSERHLNELCRMLGTSFDTVIYESAAAIVGKGIVEDRVADGIFEHSDGAVVYRGDMRGLHTRVFLNSQGLPTYEAKDLGNFSIKQDHYPHWKRSIVVTGNEQREYFKVVIQAIRDVFAVPSEKSIEHVATGFLTLTTGKMSSRLGNVLSGEAILEELRKEAAERAKETRAEDVQMLGEQIAVAALKYQILRQSVGGDMVFDKTRALSFEGDSGPYLQYTYARIGSICSNAAEAGIGALIEEKPALPYPPERLLYRFEEVVARALLGRSPHHLVTFLTSLAGEFNAFYAAERIVDTVDTLSPYKVALAAAVGQTLKNGLYLLGIEAPERM